MHRLAIIPALLVVAACGGASHPTTPTPAAKVAWKDMNADQRTAFMKDVVMPRSKELFMAFDAERYKDMDCKTCHGPGADDKSFEMPNPDIAPLPNSEEAYMAWIAKDEDAAWAEWSGCPTCGDPIDYCIGHGNFDEWEVF